MNLVGTAADNASLSRVWVYVGATPNNMTLTSSGNGVLSATWFGQVVITNDTTLKIEAYDITDLASDPTYVTLKLGDQRIQDAGGLSGLIVTLPQDASGETVTIDASDVSTINISTGSATITIRGVDYTVPTMASQAATRDVLKIINIDANSGSVSQFVTTISLQIPYTGDVTAGGLKCALMIGTLMPPGMWLLAQIT